MIVIFHAACAWRLEPWCNPNLIGHVLYLNIGVLGVAALVFVSGAMLEYSHPRLAGANETATFYVQRLVRLYPAYWISLVFGILVIPGIASRPVILNFIEAAGFAPYTGSWGAINIMGWFIGMIVVLYLMFPFLSTAIRRHPMITLCAIALVEVVLRYWLNVTQPGILGDRPDRYLPFCNMLEFSLGIFIVQQGFFPKWTHRSRILLTAAELSFYAYLVHYYSTLQTLTLISPVVFLFVVLVMAGVLMSADEKIQSWIKKLFFSTA